MNTKLILGVAALALTTTAFAEPMTAGSFSATGGVRSCTNTDDEECGMHVVGAIDGAYQFAFGNFTVQADFAAERFGALREEDNSPWGASAAGVHFAYRTDGWLLGGFYSGNRTNTGGNTFGRAYGFEWQGYGEDTTWYVIAGESNSIYDGGDNRFEGPILIGEGRFYVGEDARITGTFGLGHSPDGYEDAGDTGTAITFGVAYTAKMGDSSFYYTVGYSREGYNANSEDTGADERFTFGVTWLFGVDSLKAADRSGATLKTSLMPGRAAAYAEILD